MKKLFILLPLILCACESAEEKKAKWISFCVEGEFTAKQCNVLYAIKESSDDAASAATAAQISSGFAIGMSAGSGRR